MSIIKSFALFSLLSITPSLSAIAQTINLDPIRLDAGKDQRLLAGQELKLQAHILPEGATQNYKITWSQISGPKVDISSADGYLQLKAMPVEKPLRLTFQATARDNKNAEISDSLNIDILPANSISRYEAEAQNGVTLSQVSVSNEVNGYSGAGYVTGFKNNKAEAITWKINITRSDYYRIDLGYQAFDDKQAQVIIDGKSYNAVMPALDKGFHSTMIGTYFLSEGAHELTVKGGWSWYNIDYIDLSQGMIGFLPQAPDKDPSDKQATEKTKTLYHFMTSIYGHKTLSGQQDAAEMNTVRAASQKVPAIYSLDVNSYDTLAIKATGTPQAGTEDFIKTLKSFHLIGSLIWHWHAPIHSNESPSCPSRPCWWSSFYSSDTSFNVKAALADPKSKEYASLIKDIDLIAIQLKKTAAADTPILWRPLHESDGKWFWWGAAGPESFKALWRLMYERLTQHHQLHNLIWVLTIGDPSWYPGDDYVDFVGVDAYPEQKEDTLSAIWAQMNERFDGHKMLVLSEFGGVPFIDEMHKQGVWWGYFASWNDRDKDKPLGPKKMTPEELKRIYTLPNLINAGDANPYAPK